MNMRTGWVDAHTHLYSGLAGLGMPAPSSAPTSFLEILARVWWRLDRALDAASLRAAARLYVAEARAEGTTAVIDHHESPDFIEGSLEVVADACQEFGMRALVCYGATERNRGADEARAGLEECRRFFEANERPLVRGCVGLHASFTVSDATIRAAGALARELDTVVHVHVAEDAADVADARERGFDGPLERLLANEGLPTGSILAHGVHLSEEDVARCAERGFWIVQAPRSNANNRVGYPGGLARSESVALGSDGFPSSVLDEGEALVREAQAHGEPLSTVLARVYGGERIVAEHFGEAPKGQRPLERALLDEARAEAAEAAPRLWRRMEALAP